MTTYESVNLTKHVKTGYGYVGTNVLTDLNAREWHWVEPSYSIYKYTDVIKQCTDWCEKNISTVNYMIIGWQYCFINKSDATAFLLKFE